MYLTCNREGRKVRYMNSPRRTPAIDSYDTLSDINRLARIVELTVKAADCTRIIANDEISTDYLIPQPPVAS